MARCQFVSHDGLYCTKTSVGARRVELRHGDQIEVLLCQPHNMCFNAYLWADKNDQYPLGDGSV